MNHPVLSILIPAAGASERLGQAKQLVKYRGKPLLQNAVDLAHSIVPAEIIVITGANVKAVKDTLQMPGIRWLHNPHWSTGMGSSIALGAAAIHPKSTGLMIFLCDQWKLQAQDLQTLAETWRSDSQRIVVAQAEGHYMPPVIFPASCFDELRRLEGKQGARSLLQARPELLTALPVENAAFDLDSQTHLDELEQASSLHRP